MLGFFRKYQKFFFIIVTFFIVISFSFFGTSSTLGQGQKVEDREIGKLVDGSALMEQRLFGLLRLIEDGAEEGGRRANLLNGSFVHREILLPGLGEELASHYFAELKEELEAKWRRAKNFRPYVHPYAPFISAENIWRQYCPELLELLTELQNAPHEFSEKELGLLFQLYEAQSRFPANFLHQMLYYQQSQVEGVRPDQGLPEANVALFGFQSVEDWFGSKFVEKLGVFLLNAGIRAKEEGYLVGKKEAQESLFSNVYSGMKLFEQGKAPSSDEVHRVYSNHIRSLGLSEGEAISLWQTVLSCQRFFKEVGESVFVDPMSLQQFQEYAKASTKIRRFELPRELQFNTFFEMLEFQRYIEIVGNGDSASLPMEFRAPEEVQKEHPELVYHPVEVEMATISHQEIASQITLKETWRFEQQKENFETLKMQFSFLLGSEANTEEERIACLEALSEEQRFEVDQFARDTLVMAHPEWIEDALRVKEWKKRTLKLRLVGEEPLRELLTKDQLDRLNLDGNSYTSVRVLSRGDHIALYTFQEAKQEGILEELLDALLFTAYEAMEMEGEFEEVKEEVAEKVYADLLVEIAQGLEIERKSDYAKHRFDRELSLVRAAVAEGGDAHFGPYELSEREEVVGDEYRGLAVGEFSAVDAGGFFQLLEQQKVEVSAAELEKLQEPLKRDAKRTLLKKLLEDAQ